MLVSRKPPSDWAWRVVPGALGVAWCAASTPPLQPTGSQSALHPTGSSLMWGSAAAGHGVGMRPVVVMGHVACGGHGACGLWWSWGMRPVVVMGWACGLWWSWGTWDVRRCEGQVALGAPTLAAVWGCEMVIQSATVARLFFSPSLLPSTPCLGGRHVHTYSAPCLGG